MAVRRTIRAPSKALITSLALLAAVAFAAGRARAEMTLRWEAPAACPQRAEVLDRIRALTGSSRDKTDELAVEGSIERADGRFSLTLLVRDGREVRKRVIASERCADLAGAAAVTLALLLGIDVSAADTDGGAAPLAAPDAGTSSTSADAAAENARDGGLDQPSATPAAVPPKETASSDTPSTTTEPPSSRAWNVVVRAPFGSVETGPLPHPAFAVGLGIGARYDAWQVMLTGRISPDQRVAAPQPNETSGADLARTAAELSGCYGFRSRAVEIAPCATVTLEHVTAQGYGDGVSPRSEGAFWPALGVGAIGRVYPWDFLALFAGVGGAVELSRPRLVIEGLGTVSELEPVAAGASFGAEWIF
ncbi:MAG TPA: hypothetical protein VFZ53_33995 [Polyangiaceae bacterium]